MAPGAFCQSSLRGASGSKIALERVAKSMGERFLESVRT